MDARPPSAGDYLRAWVRAFAVFADGGHGDAFREALDGTRDVWRTLSGNQRKRGRDELERCGFTPEAIAAWCDDIRTRYPAGT